MFPIQQSRIHQIYLLQCTYYSSGVDHYTNASRVDYQYMNDKPQVTCTKEERANKHML